MGNELTLGSLFDGIGGFPLAGVREGIKPVWASEIEAAPVSITKRHFPAMRHLGDITRINGAEIEPVDIITFGSPCQDLSIAGLRSGLGGTRSGLFLEAVRIIKEMRIATKDNYPARIIWENVPGAFSSSGGKDFQKVLQEIAGLATPGISVPRPPAKWGWLAAGAVVGDCWSLAWRVMDAQYWGVLQRRRRIFLVADFGTVRAGEILFNPESGKGNYQAGGTVGEDCTGEVENGVARGSTADSLTMDNAVSVPFVRCGFGDYRQLDVSGTLLAGDDLNQCALIASPCSVRRLMPMEYERLQGYPDGWTEYGHDGEKISDSQRYKALGNSIAVPCVQYILSNIKI